MRDSGHVPGNTSLLQIFRAAFPEIPIRYAGHPEHLTFVRNLVGTIDDVEFVSAPVAELHDPPWKRAIIDWHALRQIFGGLNKNTEIRYIQTYCTGPSIRVTAIAARHYPNARIWYRQHGSLNEIDGWVPRNPVWRYFSLRSSLLGLKGRHTRLIVLEQAVRDQLARRLPNLAVPVDILEEAIIPAESDFFPPRPLGRPVTFALLGVATHAKGVGVFLEAAKQTKALGIPARFVMIGRLHPSLEGTDFSAVDLPPARQPLARSNYLSLLKEVDYVVMNYDNRYYGLSASGVMVDAITALKPVIAKRLPLTEQFFRDGGDIGILCNDDNSLLSAVRSIALRPNPDQYNRQVKAMSVFRGTRTVDSIARRASEVFGS